MPREEKDKELRALIAYYLERSGYSKKELALKLGICPASLYNKLKNPEGFTLLELRELFKLMELGERQILQVV